MGAGEAEFSRALTAADALHDKSIRGASADAHPRSG
jgi:hypothetical protein